LAGNPAIEVMPVASYGEPNYRLTCIIINPSRCIVSNEDIRLALENENIESRPLWKQMHLQPVFQSYRVRGGEVSTELFAKGLCLPSESGMTESDLERVVEVVRKMVKSGV